MKMDEPEKFENITLEVLNGYFDTINKDIILRIYPIYEGIYPDLRNKKVDKFNDYELYNQLLEDLNFLGSSKEHDLLVLLYYFTDKNDIICLFNQRISSNYSLISNNVAMKKTIISDNLVDLLKSLIIEGRKFTFDSDDFIIACWNGCLEMAIYLYDNGGIIWTKKNINHAFFSACCSGNLELVKLVRNLFTFKILQEDGLRFLLNSCNSGNIKLVDYVWKLLCKDGVAKFAIHCNHESVFKDACWKGNFKLAKYLLNASLEDGIGKIDIHIDREQPFRLACESENLILCKWLWEISLIDSPIKYPIKYRKIDESKLSEEVKTWLSTVI